MVSYFHPSSEISSISFTKTLKWLLQNCQTSCVLILATKSIYDVSVLFTLKVKNLNTSSSFMCHFQLWLISPTASLLGTLLFSLPLLTWIQLEHLTVGPECACSSPLRAGIKEDLTEFSFSCSPSPLGREDRLFVEFLFGVEVIAPAFFFTVSTSQLAWSSLCVLFPALITLEKKPEKLIRQSDFQKAESLVSRVSQGSLHNWHKTNPLLNAKDLSCSWIN